MTKVLEYSILTDSHGLGYLRELESVAKPQLHYPTARRRKFRTDYEMDGSHGGFVGPFVSIVSQGLYKIETVDALMNSGIAYLVDTAILYRTHQIGLGNRHPGHYVGKRGKHIMNDVARNVIVVQIRHGQPAHLRIMFFKQLLYVLQVRHTPYNTPDFPKTKP